jgi:TolA-binding protein
VAWLLIGTSVAVLAGADGPAANSKRAIGPVAPVLPAQVVAAMQEGKYAEAIAGLDRLTAEAKEPSDRAYHALIRGTAHRLAGKPAEARATWTVALKADGKGPWAAKLRYELASLELAEGRPAEAEQLARVEAERLLAGERKDRLAGIYYAFARRLLKPDDPVTPADPKGASELLKQALGLAKGADLARTIRLEMARASAASGDHPQAVAHYQIYLKDPLAPETAEAQYGLGESMFHLGHLPGARATWTDLAADLDRAPGRDRPNAAEIRAKALYQIARTYHVPNPPDSAQLQLGVAALRRFLTAYPAHAWAVRASYEIGTSYLARGESDQALAALKEFLAGKDYRAETDEAKRDLASLSMTATYQTAQILQGQQKFDDAIAAWLGYLAKFPNGPQSADAQRAILDTKLLMASEALRREKYDDARAAWSAFVAQNPLDARVPQILFQIGESYVPQEKFDDAIASWETLISKFPGSEPAAHGQFLIASIFENQKGNPAESIERFKKVTVEPWRSNAAQRIAVMESRELTVVTPRTFRSGETPHLKVTTRNLENLTFSAYKLNPEAYFRKKQALGSVETLDIGLVAPDSEWTIPVPKYAKYKPVESSYDLKVKAPGVWVVKVSDEKHLRATTLVVGSDVDAIIKASRDQLLVFAQDMKTGKGRAKARVLVSDGSGVFLEKTTGDDGVLLTPWDKPRDPNAGLQYLVVDGADVASNGLAIPGQVAQGLTARAYIYTDRPAYRPGHEVAVRGVVREARDGQYASPAGETYRFEVLDSRGRLLVARPVKLSDFGTFHEKVGLDSSAPVGSYRVRLFQPGKSEFAGSFEVQSYRLEKVDISIDLPKTVYFRGETIAADIIAKYQYGAPLANKLVEVVFSGGIRRVGRTDGAGKFHVEFPTNELAEEQTLGITARLMEENVAAVAQVAVAIRALQIGLSTTRDTYLDGESFALKVHASDPLGKPVGQGLTLAVIKRIVRKSGEVSERQVSERSVTTDAKTGDASAQVKVDDPDGGPYVLRVSGKDRFGNVVVADRVLTISGAKDETKLRLLADRLSYKVGETAKVNLHSRVPAGPALIAWEADRIIQYRISDLKEGDNPLEWAVEGPQFPNFTLTAARMSSGRFDEARLDLRVERDLRVTVAPKRPTAGPNEEVEVEITTADQLGRPVAAEVSLALVDLSLLRLFDDGQAPIGPYF